MKRNKIKQKIYIRTFAALMATYLVLMMGFSIFLIFQEREVAGWELRMFALQANDAVEEVLQDQLDDKNQVIDLAKVKRAFIKKASLFSSVETEAAIYTGDYNLIFNTTGYWIVSYTEYEEGSKSYNGYGFLNPKDWFSEKEMNELENYLNANPQVEKPGDLSGYSLDLEGFWLDQDMVIPDKISVTPMYAQTIDEKGKSITSTGTEKNIVYASGYQNLKKLPFFEFGGIQPAANSYDGSEQQIKLRQIAQNQQRLKEAVQVHKFVTDEQVGLFTCRYYQVQPYRNTMYMADDQEISSEFWTVLVREINLWDRLAGTLIFVWLSCLIAFLSVVFILSSQSYRTYQKREELERFRQETTNALAHDLKTPLSIISGYAQNLLENIHTEKRVHYAGGIQTNVNRMDKIIREMLELSRLESDSLSLESEDLSLAEVSGEIIRRYRQVCAEKFITVQLAGDAVLKGDPALFDRVLNNFFVNALDNTPDGGIIRIQITDNKLEFYNSGSHIPKDKLDEIWQPYKKVDTSRGNSKGTGLGLAIAQSIFELYHYSYGAKNSNNGVVFWFKFA
jgi:signal transduction histidine kinase